MADVPEFLIGFVGLFTPSGADGTIGAAMVVNERGYPLEFRVTTPVRPSAVQRALYGDSLDRYVSSELVAKRLIAEIARRPAAILVNRLNAVETECPVPLAFISDSSEFVLTNEAGYSLQTVEGMAGGHGSIALVSVDASGATVAADLIREAGRSFEPLGVFGRMETALRVLAESDSRYR